MIKTKFPKEWLLPDFFNFNVLDKNECKEAIHTILNRNLHDKNVLVKLITFFIDKPSYQILFTTMFWYRDGDRIIHTKTTMEKETAEIINFTDAHQKVDIALTNLIKRHRKQIQT